MSFNSFEYLIFFPLCVTLFFLLPQRFRWVLLLAASYYFYMCWSPSYGLLLVLTTAVDFFAALGMEKTRKHGTRKTLLILSLASNLGLLFFFKYYNFLGDSLNWLFRHYNLLHAIPSLKLLLPVGISFYVFQSLSYTIDVYRGDKKAERHPGIFALYVVFFPQLVAGPIERSTRLLPQFYEKKSFSYRNCADGLKLMAWGFFKKAVIADQLAVYVNAVYNHPHDFTGFALLAATYCFAFQIYFDFSGYSDIAIGSARVMGYRLCLNFDQPYLAGSIHEFWKRWHISLTSWFRDYLYFPLGGNRVSTLKWIRNILIVFGLSGLWHGARWTFLIWGLLHACYYLASAASRRMRVAVTAGTGLDQFPALHAFLRTAVTFHLVLFSWIFFRANSLADAGYIITHLADGSFPGLIVPGFGSAEWLLSFCCVAFAETVQYIHRRGALRGFIHQLPIGLRFLAYACFTAALCVLTSQSGTQFIYFRF